VAMLRVRHAIELITQSKIQGEVAADLPTVLRVPVILMLAKVFVVSGLSRGGLVEEFGIVIEADESPKSGGIIFQFREAGQRGINYRRIQHAETVEVSAKINLPPRIEVVEPALPDAAEIHPEFKVMRPPGPAQAVAKAGCSRRAVLTIGQKGIGAASEWSECVEDVFASRTELVDYVDAGIIQDIQSLTFERNIKLVPTRAECVEQSVGQG